MYGGGGPQFAKGFKTLNPTPNAGTYLSVFLSVCVSELKSGPRILK